MPGQLEAILGALRLAPRILFALWLFGALVLLLPPGPANALGLDAFRTTHRQWLGLGTLGTFVLWLTNVSLIIARWTKGKFDVRRRRAVSLRALDTLNQEELLLLAYFTYRGAPTQELPLNYPPARSLVAKGLLRVTAGSGNMFAWPYIIPDFVWQELQFRRQELFPDIDSDEARALFARFPKRMIDRM
jgi:hypothetical protein